MSRIMSRIADYLKQEGADMPPLRRNIIPVLIRGFSPSVPNSEKLTEAVKTMIELYSTKIDGLYSGFEFQFNGEHLDLVERHSDSVPVIEYANLYGPFKDLHRHWMEELLLPVFKEHPDLEIDDERLVDTTVDVLFFEPDPTHTVAVAAWFCKNFHPFSVEMEGVRDIQRPLQPSLRVKYAGKTEQGEAIDKLAASTLSQLIAASSNPYERADFVNRAASNTNPNKQ